MRYTKSLSVLLLCLSNTTHDDEEMLMATLLQLLSRFPVSGPKPRVAYSTLVKTESKPRLWANEEPEIRSPQSHIHLPAEIIIEIVGNIQDQRDLLSLTRVNRIWSAVASNQLYKSPTFSSVEQFEKFIDIFSRIDTSERVTVQKIVFQPCQKGSLSSRECYQTEELNNFHSVFFRMLVRDREQKVIPHPTLFTLLELCPNIQQVCEQKIGKSRSPSIPLNIEDSYGNLVFNRYFIACKELERESYASLGHAFSLQPYRSSAKRLLFLANLRNTSSLSQSVSACRSILSQKGSTMMTKLTACILAQVQYMTFCSQKLLDCFTMVNYREFLFCSCVRFNLPGCFSLSRHTRLEALHQPELPDASFNEEYQRIIKSVESIIDRARTQDPDVNHPISGNLSFVSPSCLNGEVIEFVTHQALESTLSPNHPYFEELDKFQVWLKELSKWFSISKELEAVRQLLRSSLDEIEVYRRLQTESNVIFMT